MKPTTTTLFLTLLTIASAATTHGCQELEPATTPEACALATSAIEACGIAAPFDLMERCSADPTAYEELLEASCEDIALAFDSGRADGMLWGKPWGGSCVLDVQCEGDLVCRPIEPYYELPWNYDGFQSLWVEMRCLRPAGDGYDICEGAYCGDDDDDCGDEGLCVSIDDLDIGWRMYVCRSADSLLPFSPGPCSRPNEDYERMRAGSDEDEQEP